jgi:hypothetical protein
MAGSGGDKRWASPRVAPSTRTPLRTRFFRRLWWWTQVMGTAIGNWWAMTLRASNKTLELGGRSIASLGWCCRKLGDPYATGPRFVRC